MDCIELTKIITNSIIGVYPHERVNRQELLISARIYTDFIAAAQSDDLMQSVNYVEILRLIKERCETTSYQLLEALIEDVAQEVLKIDGVEKIWLRIDKPNAVAPVNVALEIERKRK